MAASSSECQTAGLQGRIHVRYKALMIVHCLNQLDGLDWEAYPLRYDVSFRWRIGNAPDLLFSCVDSRSARRMIHQYAVANHQVHRNGRVPGRCQRIDGS